MKKLIDTAVTEVNSRCEKLRRDVATIEQTRNAVPVCEAEVKSAKEGYELGNEAQLDQLIRSKGRLELAVELLKNQPSKLTKPIEALFDALQTLNGALLDASKAETAKYIEEVSALLVPYAGTQKTGGIRGTFNPAKDFAQQMPILETVGWKLRSLGCQDATSGSLTNLLQIQPAKGSAENEFELGAARILEEAAKTLGVASAWQKLGGKFAERLS